MKKRKKKKNIIKTKKKINKKNKKFIKNKSRRKKKKRISKRKIKKVIKGKKIELDQNEEELRLNEEIELRLKMQKQEDQIQDEQINYSKEEKNIFVHLSALQNSGLTSLKVDDLLTFEVEHSDKGLSAVNLQKTVNELFRPQLKVIK